MAFLAYDSELLLAIRNEIASLIQNDQFEEEQLLERSPKLQSLINEVLRLSVITGLVREIVKPTLVQGKLLKARNKLMIPYRRLHLNRDVWGHDPSAMEPLRFELNPKLANSKSYRPFGGDNTLCPGHFLARRSIGFVVALLVSRFQIDVDPETQRKEEKDHDIYPVPKFPGMNTTKPSPGASLPVEGHDVTIILRERTNSRV